MCLLQGADIFCAKVNLEVQVASETAIAAIERNGGVITTSYYDPRSLRKCTVYDFSTNRFEFDTPMLKIFFVLEVLIKPVPHFISGQPIPKRMLPGEDLLPYYTDASNRGYLANLDEVQAARLALAKKYGYSLPDITKDELYEMLAQRKGPRQIFFGLSPGWVVNMEDKTILKPTDEKVLQYYGS